MSLGEVAAERWQGERADAREDDLAAVGVAGENERDQRSAGVDGDDAGEVGLVDHEENGGVGGWGDGQEEIGMAIGVVVDAGEDDAGVTALDGDVLVHEEGEAIVGHVVADEGGAHGDIVVAQAAEAQGAGEGGEQLCTAGGGGERGGDGEGAAGDEVAGDKEEIGGERVDAVDDAAQEELFGELFKVNVRELDDAEAIEWLGEIGDDDGAVGDVELVAGDLIGVKHEAGGCGGGAKDEVAAGVGCRFWGRS